MKKLLVIFCILFSLTSCDLVIRGVSKKAIETLEKREADKPKEKKNGEIKSYFKNGKIKTRINYINDVKDGAAVTYYENGNIKLSMFYKNGVKDGPASYYYENGKIYRESNYVDGELDGIRKNYENGRLTAEEPYKKGQTGKGLKEYFTSGKLKKDYPKLEFEEIDTRKKDHAYTIKIKFSERHPKDKFYVGELEDGLYLQDELYPLLVQDGVGVLQMNIPPDARGSQTIHFIGVHHTTLGNSYVTDYVFDVKIK